MPTRLITLDGVPKGLYKTYDKVTLALIYKAGHMAPRDQPELLLCIFHICKNTLMNSLRDDGPIYTWTSTQ